MVGYQRSHSLTSQAFWLMAAKVAGFAFMFFMPLVVARVLDQHNYGLYKQAFLLIATAQTTLPLGLGMSAFYFFPRQPEKAPYVVFNILLCFVLIGLASAAIIIGFPQITQSLLGTSELQSDAPLIGLVIFLRIVSSFLEIVATANQDVKYSTIFIVSAQWTRSVLMIGAALVAASVHALLIASLVQGVLQTAAMLWYLNKRFPGFWSSFEWRLLREQLSYSLPIGSAAIIYNLQADLHSYFVSHNFDSAQFAIYAVGCMQLPLVGLLRDSAGSVLIPRVSYLQQAGEHSSIMRLLARASRKLAAFYWPLFAFLLVCGGELIVLMYTRNYAASVPIFAVNLLLLPLNILISDPVLRGFAMHRFYLLKVRIVSLAAMIVALYFGVAKFGLMAAISIVVITALIEAVVTSVKVARILEVTMHDLRMWADVVRLGAAAGVAAILTAAVRQLVVGHPFKILAVCGVVFVVAYALLIVLMRIPDTNERAMVRSALNRVSQLWRGPEKPVGVE